MALYGKQANDLDLENYAAEIKLRANIRLGEISKELEKSKGGSNPEATLRAGAKSKSQSLKDAGVSKDQAYRAEALADMPEAEREDYIAKRRLRKNPFQSLRAYCIFRAGRRKTATLSRRLMK